METQLSKWTPVVKPYDTGVFEAQIPARQVAYLGNSADEALANLIKGYAELSRVGAINPHDPDASGVPPIQHALNILTELLAKRVTEREKNRWLQYDHDMKNGITSDAPTWGSGYAKGPGFTRDNEVISGLATAVAALARVKEL